MAFLPSSNQYQKAISDKWLPIFFALGPVGLLAWFIIATIKLKRKPLPG